jgi:hypothetical protein
VWPNKEEAKGLLRPLLFETINASLAIGALGYESKVEIEQARINEMAHAVLIAMLNERQGNFSYKKVGKIFSYIEGDGPIDRTTIKQLSYSVLLMMLLDGKQDFSNKKCRMIAEIAYRVYPDRNEVSMFLKRLLLDAIDRIFF